MFTSLFPIVYAPPPTPKPNDYFEYPTQTWIIEKQDYFGSFLEWDFIPVDGQSGDKRVWNFTWQHLDYYKIRNDTTGEIIKANKNPIYKIREAYDNTTQTWNSVILTEVYNKTSELSSFKNWGDFQSDCKRLVLSNYPIVPEDKEDFTGLHTNIDIFNFNNGSFIVTFKDQWKLGKKVTIGFGSTITYSGVTNIITCTGGTEGSPITFWDLWNASYVNGLYKVWNNQLNNTQYQFDCRIQVGDGSTETWFADVDKQILFTDVGSPFFDVKVAATVTLGTVVDATLKVVKQGCSFIFDATSGWGYGIRSAGTVYVYGCFFESLVSNDIILYKTGGIFRLWHVSSTEFIKYYGISDIYGGYNTRGIQVPSYATIEDFILLNPYKAVVCWNEQGWTLKDVIIVKATNTLVELQANPPEGSEIYLVNVISNLWHFIHQPNLAILRQYIFDLTVTYPDDVTAIINANVTLTYSGQDGGTTGSWLTNSTGQIPTQTLSMGFYNQTGDDTIYEYNPYTLTIAKTDRQTYVEDFTLNEAVDWIISLQKSNTGYLYVVVITSILLGVMTFVLWRRRRGGREEYEWM